MNIYDQAHALARALKETDEYREYQRLKDVAMENETQKALIEEYKRLQFQLQVSMASWNSPDPAEMERLHMILDVAHLSDAGIRDVLRVAKRPFAASHSNCRALAPHCRNLTDEMIRVMAEKGGLVGLNYCSGFLDDQPRPELCRSTTALMARHAAHFKQVGGIEIIGLGSDFDGIGGKLEMGDCSKLPLLADALRKEGFTEDEVEQIFFRNAQRFFEENL